jgi:hypothetical protein
MSPNVSQIILDYYIDKHYLYAFKNPLKRKEMSDKKDPFDFTGTFGDYTVYDDPATGKRVVSRKGGPTPEQFRTSPNYARTREGCKEFGGRSKWASMFKKAFSDIGHLTHVRCYNEIVAGGRQIQQKEVDGIQGNRSIAISNNPEALAMIEFNVSHPFRNIVRFKHETSLSPDKTTVTLNIPEFITSRDVRWDKKFLAVRIYLVIAQQSDFAWNPVLEVYEPVVPDLEILSQCVASDWIYQNSEINQVTLTASFEEPAFSAPGTSVIVAMGVEFSLQAIMGQPYVTPGNGSAAIVGYFGS